MNNKESKNLTKLAIEGSIWYGITTLIQRFGGLVFTIILARALLPEGFGLFNLALSLISLIFIFFQAGPDRTFGRYIATAKNNKNRERSFFKFIFKVKTLSIIIVSIITILIAYPLSEYLYHKRSLFAPLVLATIYFFFFSFVTFFTYFFIVIKKVKYVAIKELVFQAARMLLIFLPFFIIFIGLTVNYIFFVLIISTLASLIYIFHKIRKISPYLFTGKTNLNKKQKNKILIFMWYMAFSATTVVFLGNLDTVMIGFFINDFSSIGLYKSALILVTSIASLIGFSTILVPFFVELNNKKLEHAFNKTYRLLNIISIPITFGLLIFGNYFLTLFYGKEYIEAALPLYFLTPLIILSINVGLYRELFSAKESPKDILVLTAGVIILNIILNFILIKALLPFSNTWAITGAAISTSLSWVVLSFGLSYRAHKKLNIKTDNKAIIKPFIASIIMALILILFKELIKNISIFIVFLLVIFGALIYIYTMFIIKGINKDDIMVFKILIDKAKQYYKPQSQPELLRLNSREKHL